MAVQTSDSMMNKRVKTLAGDREKIVKVLSTKYVTDAGTSIPARKLMQKGKSFIETELTMRELEDTGAGYVVAAETASAKKPAAKKTSSRKTSAKKTSTRRSKKAAAEEKPARKTKRKSAKPAEDKTTGRKKRRAKKQVEEVVELPALTFEGEQPLRAVRQELETVVSDFLNERYSNISAVLSDDLRTEESPEVAVMRFQVAIERPMPTHHSVEYYLDIAQQAGAKAVVKLKPSIAERLCTALNVDEMPSAGDVFADESGARFVFGGTNTADKCFVFVSVDDEQVAVQTLAELNANEAEFLDGLDLFGDFQSVMGDSIEDVQATNTDVDLEDDSLDFDEDQRLPIKDLDWDNLDEATAIEILSGNYTREELEAFAVEELDASEAELEFTDNELVAGIVSAVLGADDFEEDEDMEAEDDDMEEDTETDVNSLDAKIDALIEANVITEAMRSILNEDQVDQMFQEQFGDNLEEEDMAEEETVEAEPVSIEDMRATMIESGIPEATVGIFQDAQVEEWYAQNVGSAVEAVEGEFEEVTDDEDMVDDGELEDDENMVELEEADEIEDDGMTESADVDPENEGDDDDFDIE